MGIKGLGKFVGDFAPRAIKRQEPGSFTGRVIAIDASMSLYQFMVAIRDGNSFGNFTNDAGDCTSHIAGMLNRAIRLLEQGVRPVYVFDGKPPELKSGELAKRRELRESAQEAAEKAREEGNVEELRKQIVRSVRVSKQHNEDVKRLLRLMGLPVVEAPCEAEAQCAELTKNRKVWATATEDADALTFGATRLIRNLTFGERASGSGASATASGILVIDLPTLLEELQFSQEQFIDFCILCGCDYCGTLKGVGAKTAYSLVKEHGSIEKILEVVDPEKVPDGFCFQEAREFFRHPEVTPADRVHVAWGEVDVDGLKAFLVQENQFNEQRVENYITRLKKARGKTAQTRLESFFGATVTKSSSLMHKQLAEKQKELEKKKNRSVRGFAALKGKTAGARPAGATAPKRAKTPEEEPAQKKAKRSGPQAEGAEEAGAEAERESKKECERERLEKTETANAAKGEEKDAKGEPTAEKAEKVEVKEEATEATADAAQDSGGQEKNSEGDEKTTSTDKGKRMSLLFSENASVPSPRGETNLFAEGEGEENVAPSGTRAF
ncbi:putative flap structure-specific endonuclease 1 [Toxoplasma gondii TgCatPRC2]|uniref:Flap endonuclease 1 n=6 Tax=Toxoplasma gondii TaxID=5811 RepID=B6KHT0_TOXGV|nr:flap structure-specific endonuclease 1, putative [Toxoplasma gondii ME49]ESS34572.1 putative flap structure-specific endonuclease 1 [Toxoplasma gondii VEG]KFG57662.1 putative flap structure-specific endonuclease 1 [Toxoplasma gondii RUB]KYK62971.1 putative flap structure-specific endonuclease 1 [Toxoplasma gondii TgCatPRC2]EPT25227.1 flap structure-specific endonuclease 1, putative [Toxoplasma gondii ME49]CEL78682.1 TPA: flap endonuclease-1, putative [Toxoplasma gondii VEG]|eukprot:XP_002367403.1 flap structure-specific endonuclease 1, putative [Toxoplasma gondii ME49]